jgi:hypothetical protein
LSGTQYAFCGMPLAAPLTLSWCVMWPLAVTGRAEGHAMSGPLGGSSSPCGCEAHAPIMLQLFYAHAAAWRIASWAAPSRFAILERN